nr:NAD(P)H-dependent oxidoreductase [Syntrophomonas wolfei]
MKVLLVNGSAHKEGCTYTALREVEKALNKNGIATEIFQLDAEPIAGCKGQNPRSHYLTCLHFNCSGISIYSTWRKRKKLISPEIFVFRKRFFDYLFSMGHSISSNSRLHTSMCQKDNVLGSCP